MLQFIIRSSLVAIQLPLLKGAKCDSAEQGIVRFWKGWCGARDSADVKAYKCIQMIALRKADGIVRVREGW